MAGAAASGAAAGSFLAPETLGLSILVGAGVGAIGGWIGGMINHSQEEERHKEAQIRETERLRLWRIEEQKRFDRENAEREEKERVAAVKHNEAAWLGQHKFTGKTTYEEAFAEYTTQQEAREAEKQEVSNKPFVLQQQAA